ncbi:envelope glycoprotein [Merluccius polli]|uniref:Envelope glycoprotein n=1 Tax=Merluccius polli TaxID=89951 RepID=A0AA47PD52_MERPO|nr:envelope glycoprotein [Merluccius polli]
MWPNNSLIYFGLVWIFLSFCHHPVAGLLHHSITDPLATRLNEPPPPVLQHHPDIARPPRQRYIHRSRCAIALFMKKDPANCATLSSVFPPGLNNSAAPAFKIGGSNYTCLQRDRDVTGNSKSVGSLAQSLCNTIINVTEWKNVTRINIGRKDLYWLCGPNILLLTLPPTWSGRCTLARLVVPITMVGPKEIAAMATKEGRQKRNAGSEWDAPDRDTWIDSIGVPRGVPNEFKLVDQIAAGFENLPLISALFPVTPNKNIDRINYIHYNVQKLSNRTRDAVTGLSEQLAATSLMAFQNRLALDVLLAEKGGVCAMFGDQCCTFIPNNTAPDGSVTKALAGLRALSNLMAEDSGVENPLEEWFTGMFGKWKAFMMSLFMSVAVFSAILITCGCCGIPCMRALIVRLINRALSAESDQNLQMLLFTSEEQGLYDLENVDEM